MRGASRTLRCVCVLQLLISGDTVEIDLKAPRHSSCPPLGTVPCPRAHACSTHHRLMIHKARCAWSHTRTRTLSVAHPARSERVARSRQLRPHAESESKPCRPLACRLSSEKPEVQYCTKPSSTSCGVGLLCTKARLGGSHWQSCGRHTAPLSVSELVDIPESSYAL